MPGGLTSFLSGRRLPCMDLAAIAAFTAAGISLVNVAITVRATSKTSLQQWRLPGRPGGRPYSATENDYLALTSCSRRGVSRVCDGVTADGRGPVHACQTISSAARLPTIPVKFIPADIQAG